jgi:hypothetical protein
MQELGHEVLALDTEPPHVRRKMWRLRDRLLQKLLGPRDLAGINRRLKEAVRASSPQVLWLDKALAVKARLLRELKALFPRMLIVGYSPDDMARRHNQSREFLKGLRHYDLYFSTKSYNVAELKALGARQVVFVPSAYDPYVHRPQAVPPRERLRLGGPVGFIGDYEAPRAQALLYLATGGIKVRVWGPNWLRKCRLRHPNLRLEGRPLWGQEYAQAIASFDINLCFLKRSNRDLHTTRSMEIPASGGFMLAERSPEHLAFFQEGTEAEFFDSHQEMLQKVRYYLRHPQQRAQVARAGRLRCIRGGYSNHRRLRWMLKILQELLDGAG